LRKFKTVKCAPRADMCREAVTGNFYTSESRF
jgi:hypothetical protein